jgi:hypothetical protein
MARQIRKKSGTGIYHVMLRGINRQDIFEDNEDYVHKGTGTLCCGHYLQSQSSGWAYLFKYGIPSVIDFHKNKGKTANYLDRNGNVKIIGKHSIHDAEIDANKRAAQYFSKKGVLYYNDYDGWNYESKNPTYSSPL